MKILVLILLSAATLTAQELPEIKTEFRLGAFGGYSLNRHDTRATLFVGCPECGAFSNGEGAGGIGGIMGEFPIMGKWLDLTASILYAQRGGAFNEAVTGQLPILDPSTGHYTELKRRHAYSANLGYLIGEFGLRIQPLEEVPVYLRLGSALGSPLAPTQNQTEEILSPGGVLYPETNTAIRDVVSNGEIPGVDMLMSATGTLGYNLPIGARMTLSPEIGYAYSLNDVTPNYKWRVNSIQAGAAIKYTFGPEIQPPLPPVPPPPPADPLPPVVALGQDPPRTVRIMQTVVTETFPILPYIFFDSASATIPARYGVAEENVIGTFDERALPHRSLQAYYRILDILGSRMARLGSTTVTLNGTTDGAEITTGSMKYLAQGRAQEVRRYLMTRWGIDGARIKVSTSATPSYPSSTVYGEGMQENRRVEIFTSSDELLQPLIFERFSEYQIDPGSIGFTATAGSAEGIRDWRIEVNAAGRSLMVKEGSSAPPAALDWRLDTETAERIVAALGSSVGGMQGTLTVADASGRPATARMDIPVVVEQNPFEISRLSLVVFDFDRSDIGMQNRRMISSFLSRSMSASSSSSIIGSTDRLGEVEHNQQLSTQRAFAVRDVILTERPDAAISATQGVGPSRLPYDNDLPEGRYYCRTVAVEMKTPIAEVTER